MPPRRQRSQIPEYDYPLSQMVTELGVSGAARGGQLGFDYSQLSEKYPTVDIRRMTEPRFMQREIDERDIELKMQEAELARRQADLQILDTQINQQRGMYQQIPMARQAVSQLDPLDDDFLSKFIAVQNENPLAFEDDSFYRTVAAPLLRRHEMLQQNKMIMQRGQQPQTEEQKQITPSDYQDMVVRRNALLGKKKLEELQTEDPDTAFAVEELNRMIFQYQQQNAPRGGFGGMQQPAPSGTPIPSATPAPQGGGFNALRSFIGE